MNSIQGIINSIVEGNFAYAMDDIKDELKIRIAEQIENQKPYVLEQYGMEVIDKEKECDCKDGETCDVCKDKKQEEESCKK
jgi:hypothetical protein